MALYESAFFSRHLKEAQALCESTILRIPVQGTTIKFWKQDWGQGLMRHNLPTLYTFAVNQENTVREIITTTDLLTLFKPISSDQGREEFEELIPFRERLCQQIATSQETIDQAYWKPHNQGIFSVKSAYFRLSERPRTGPNLKAIWKLNVPPRFKVFAWLLYHNKILTVNNLKARGFVLVGMCYMCRNNEDSTTHLFNEC